MGSWVDGLLLVRFSKGVCSSKDNVAELRSFLQAFGAMKTDYQRLTLERQMVFGWTMYPGYGGYPYRSPIIVEDVVPQGGRTFDLGFINIFYAAGVQKMTYRLRTLRRERTFQVAEALEYDGSSERVVIIEPMTRAWFEDHAPALVAQLDRLFSASDKPDPEAFRVLMATTF